MIRNKKRKIKKDYFIFFSYLKYRQINYHILKDGTVIIKDNLIFDLDKDKLFYQYLNKIFTKKRIYDNLKKYDFKEHLKEGRCQRIYSRKLSENILLLGSGYKCHCFMTFPEHVIIEGNLNTEMIISPFKESLTMSISFGKKLTVEGNELILNSNNVKLNKNREILVKNGIFRLIELQRERFSYSGKQIKIININNRIIDNYGLLSKSKRLKRLITDGCSYQEINTNTNTNPINIANTATINNNTTTTTTTTTTNNNNNNNIHFIASLYNENYIDIESYPYDLINCLTEHDGEINLSKVVIINIFNLLAPNILHFKLLINNSDIDDCIKYNQYNQHKKNNTNINYYIKYKQYTNINNNNKFFIDEINEDDVHYFLTNKEKLESYKRYDLNNIIYYCRNKQAFNFLYKNGYKFSQEEFGFIPNEFVNIRNIYEMYLLKNQLS